VKVTHAVEADGRVYCAQQRKKIDVLSCYECKRLSELDLDSKNPRVICALDELLARPPDGA